MEAVDKQLKKVRDKLNKYPALQEAEVRSSRQISGDCRVCVSAVMDENIQSQGLLEGSCGGFSVIKEPSLIISYTL